MSQPQMPLIPGLPDVETATPDQEEATRDPENCCEICLVYQSTDDMYGFTLDRSVFSKLRREADAPELYICLDCASPISEAYRDQP